MEPIGLRDDGSAADGGPLVVDGVDRALSGGQQWRKLVRVADGSERWSEQLWGRCRRCGGDGVEELMNLGVPTWKREATEGEAVRNI